jgi:hypothetical protein
MMLRRQATVVSGSVAGRDGLFGAAAPNLWTTLRMNHHLVTKCGSMPSVSHPHQSSSIFRIFPDVASNRRLGKTASRLLSAATESTACARLPVW